MTNTIFSKDNLKGISPALQSEIIRRFNDYDTLIRVMKLTAGNIIDLSRTSKDINQTDKTDLKYLATRLEDATQNEWLKENKLFY